MTQLPYCPTINRERRYRRTYIGHSDMLDILRGELSLSFAPLPADVYLETVSYDYARRGWYLILWSSEFPIVPDGQEIPYHDDPIQQLRTAR